MSNLTRASRELFRRTPDETYSSLEALLNRCHQQREKSEDHWISPTALWTRPMGSDLLQLTAGEDKAFAMNDWSFGQLCRLAGVTKETVNRLTPDTASRVFAPPGLTFRLVAAWQASGSGADSGKKKAKQRDCLAHRRSFMDGRRGTVRTPSVGHLATAIR